ILQSLAGLFDAIAPDERPEAEEELRDAGLDSAAIGRQLKRTAQTALGHQVGARRRPSHDASATTVRRAADSAPKDERPRVTRKGIRFAGSAAALVLMFFVGYAVGRSRIPANVFQILMPGIPQPTAGAARGAGSGTEARWGRKRPARNLQGAPAAPLPPAPPQPAQAESAKAPEGLSARVPLQELDTLSPPAAALP